MKTKWETIKLSPPPDYDIENAMFDKAEKYYDLVVFASNDSKYSIELLPIVQLAAECYLKNIIENLCQLPITFRWWVVDAKTDSAIRLIENLKNICETDKGDA